MPDNSIKIDISPGKGTVGGSNFSFEVDDAIDKIAIRTPNIGQIRFGQITNIDLVSSKITVYIISDKQTVECDYFGLMANPIEGVGIFHGLKRGDIVVCGISFGNKYVIHNKVGYLNSDLQDLTLTDSDISSLFFQSDAQKTYTTLNIDELTDNSFIIQSIDSRLKLSQEETFLGNLSSGYLYLDTNKTTQSQESTLLTTASQEHKLTDNNFSIIGSILRNTSKVSIEYLDPKYFKNWYKNLSPISFDPTIVSSTSTISKNQNDSNSSVKRNPQLMENRQTVLEYSEDYYIDCDLIEAKKQNPNNKYSDEYKKSVSRRQRKEDCFSLSLVAPNYLFEKIEGTGVDINGNILDLNRTVLPIGLDGIAKLEGTEDSFLKVKELHRKGLAYHWEMNARKDPSNSNINVGNGDSYGSTDDYLKRNRSRLFVDIDKEGQFKINIPSSSEIGNVGVLSRYENYTTLNPIDENYDRMSRSENGVDILLDNYGFGCATILGNDKLIPKDRITSESIKLGTAFHDISKTCVYPQQDDTQINGILAGPDSTIEDIDLSIRKILKNTPELSVISKEIICYGDKANAGGRSGTLVSDGMWNISIGANTIDRQSLWLDLQGGKVERIGCDKNGISCLTQTDGDYYLQVGGEPYATDPDSRFSKDTSIVVPNSNKSQRFEIRVIQGNGCFHRIVLDQEGILISSAGDIQFRADQDIIMYAGSSIRLNAETVLIHKDDMEIEETYPHRQTRIASNAYVQDASGDGREIVKPNIGISDEI